MCYESHDFYCLKCGKKTIPLSRNYGHKHARGHRKKLYCPWCKMECNAIEITSMEEKEEFERKFAEGAFKDEAEESVTICGAAGKR